MQLKNETKETQEQIIKKKKIQKSGNNNYSTLAVRGSLITRIPFPHKLWRLLLLIINQL